MKKFVWSWAWAGSYKLVKELRKESLPGRIDPGEAFKEIQRNLIADLEIRTEKLQEKVEKFKVTTSGSLEERKVQEDALKAEIEALKGELPHLLALKALAGTATLVALKGTDPKAEQYIRTIKAMAPAFMEPVIQSDKAIMNEVVAKKFATPEAVNETLQQSESNIEQAEKSLAQPNF